MASRSFWRLAGYCSAPSCGSTAGSVPRLEPPSDAQRPDRTSNLRDGGAAGFRQRPEVRFKRRAAGRVARRQSRFQTFRQSMSSATGRPARVSQIGSWVSCARLPRTCVKNYDTWPDADLATRARRRSGRGYIQAVGCARFRGRRGIARRHFSPLCPMRSTWRRPRRQ